MVIQIIDRTAGKVEFSSPRSSIAARLSSRERTALSVKALARSEPITQLASDNGVSRRFIYKQAAKADKALKKAFDSTAEDANVLFHLPVTKRWIQQFVLAQILIGHTSYRGVMEILDIMFDYRDISIGGIHNIVRAAVSKARTINAAGDLSRIRVGAHDEIYQAGTPVLVGVDVESTYCYLLAAEDHCDETTWGVHLLDLHDAGLSPDFTIGDGGRALRAGQAAAWENIPCHGDIFHILRDIGALAYFLENRASGCTSAREKLERKMQRAKKRNRGQTFSKKLAVVRQQEAETTELARDIRIMADWLQRDILSLAGPNLQTRRELFDFVVGELRVREHLCSHRIRSVRRALENQRDNLLAFAGVLDQKLADIATCFDVPTFLVHAVCELQGMDKTGPFFWEHENRIRKKLRSTFYDIERAVKEAMADTPRASSIVENLNSRLRNYFFLRRHIGNEYLDLLQFFINHRRFLRSDRPERVGKSPKELLSGESHPSWLELLGFELFQRN